MKNQFNNRCVFALALLFLAASLVSGCGFFQKQSRRTITATHWGAEKGGPGGFSNPSTPAAPAEGGGEAGAQDAEQASAGDTKADDASAAAGEADAAGAIDTAAASASTANIGVAANASAASDEMTLYVSYIEAISTKNLLNNEETPMSVKSVVRFCNLKTDNSLVCTENAELNKMLNPHLQAR